MKRFLLPIAFLLAGLANGCIDTGVPAKVITVTGIVTDTATGAGISGATVQVVFGSCDLRCSYLGAPGFAPTDGLGHYTVAITGPTSDCGSFAYYVFVDAGSSYFVGNKAFDCGPVTQQVDFSMHGVKAYTVSGTITHAESGAPIRAVTVSIGLYGSGTSCIGSTTCQALAGFTTDTPGEYLFSFPQVYSAAECNGKEFVVTVQAGADYKAGEGRFPCGQFTTTLNLALAPPG